MPLLQVMKHQASSSVLQISASMTFSASDFTMDLPMVVTEAELRAAPCIATEYHPIQQSLGIMSMRDRRRSLPEPDTPARSKSTGVKQIFVLARVGTLGPPPFILICRSPDAAKRLPAETVAGGESARSTLAEPHRPESEPKARSA